MKSTPKQDLLHEDELVEECFNSIKSGTPITIETAHYINGSPRTVKMSCLEHMLLEIVHQGSGEPKNKRSPFAVNSKVFSLADDPSVDTMELCQTRLFDGTTTNRSCVPNIIDAFSALKQYRDPFPSENGESRKNPYANERFNGVMRNVRNIIRRNPDVLKQRLCRSRRVSRYQNRDHIGCLDSIISQGNNWRVIDLNTIPTDILRDAECTYDFRGYRLNASSIPCLEVIVRMAIDNSGIDSRTVATSYANTLLTKILSMERFDDDMLRNPTAISHTDSIDWVRPPNPQSLFDLLMWGTGNHHWSGSSYGAIKAVVSRFTKDGIIDTTSAYSPFSGNQCTSYGSDPSAGGTPASCIGELLSKLVTVPKPRNMSKTDDSAYTYLSDLVLSQPSFGNGKCGVIMTLLRNYMKGGGGLTHSGVQNSIALLAHTLGFDSSNESSIYDALVKASAITCENDENQPFPTPNGADIVTGNSALSYALLGADYSGTHYQTPANRAFSRFILEPDRCTDPNNGNPIPCVTRVVMGALEETFPSDYAGERAGQGIARALLPLGEPAKKVGSTTLDSHILQLIHGYANYAVPSEKCDVPTLQAFALRLLDRNQYRANAHLMDGVIGRLSSEGYDDDKQFGSSLYHIRLSLSDEELLEVIRTGSYMFSSDRMIESIYNFISSAYDDGNDDIKSAIRLKYIPKSVSTQSVGKTSYRYMVDKYLQEKTKSKDPRYKCIFEYTDNPSVKKSVMLYNRINGITPPKPGEGGDLDRGYNNTLQERLDYDISCMHDMNNNEPYVNEQAFVEDWLNKPEEFSKMQDDPLDIVGSYELYAKPTWTQRRIDRYGSALYAIIYGDGRVLDEVYARGKNHILNIDKGIEDVFASACVSEPVGRRDENRTATPSVSYRPSPSDFSSTSERWFSEHDNDFDVIISYIDDKTGEEIGEMRKVFGFRNILKSLPKRIMKKLQESAPQTFSAIQNVVLYENEYDKSGGKTYTLNISNKPQDLMRASTNQTWDDHTCLMFGQNPNIYNNCIREMNESNGGRTGYNSKYSGMTHYRAIQDFIDFRSYVAFITDESPYEPKWYSRLFMHRCRDMGTKEENLVVQENSTYFSADSNRSFFASTLDAVKVILADKGINKNCNGSACKFYWIDDNGQTLNDKRGYRRQNYVDKRECNTITKHARDLILKTRTGQDINSEAFVKRISNTF